MKLSKDFSLSEFRSKDGAPFPPEVIENLKKLAVNLQIIRNHVDVPISINSGYRSPSHNEAVGGKNNSYHLKGMAGDLSCSLSPSELHEEIKALMDDGEIEKGGLSEYSSFVHYDIRGRFATW